MADALRTIRLAAAAGLKLAAEASLLQREPVDIGELVVGLKCGGSDPTSGIAANVVMGETSDLLTGMGGTVILTETAELIDAEHLLAGRAVSAEVAEKKNTYFIKKQGGL